MRIRVGINDMDRIGREVLRCAIDRAEPGFQRTVDLVDLVTRTLPDR